MADNKIFNFLELQYEKLTNQVTNWLSEVYNKASINLDATSPFGQILDFLKEIYQSNIIYLKNSLTILDIENTYNKKVIQQVARISGHNVGRAISATGTLKFKLKPGIDIEKEIKDSVIIIYDKTILKNLTNNLEYSVKLNVEKNIFPVNISSTEFYLPIIQGNYESQTFTGDNTDNQSYSVNIARNTQIENNNIIITYNGINVKIKDHKYDILKDEVACYIRSGFNGGIDIYFGSKNNGFIPAENSIIEISYLLSNGSEGEIFNNVENDWKMVSEITDGQGNIIKIEDLFNITINTDINFASDGESIEYTKAIIPYVSRNFVLATPDQFIFHLKKLNMFSKVNAYNKLSDNNFSVNDVVIENQIKSIISSVNKNESKTLVLNKLDDLLSLYSKQKLNLNDNSIYLYLIPDIKKYFNDNINYFNISFEVFYLNDDEQNKIINYLRQLGTMNPNIEIHIVKPIISRYIMHIYIQKFEDADEDNIRQEIISLSSDYLLNNDRFDRIPKSDLVIMFKNIYGVDSASVYFVSEKNEQYHKQSKDLGYSDKTDKKYDDYGNLIGYKEKVQPILDKHIIMKNGKFIKNKSYSEDDLIGIDNVHGDIIAEQNEYVIIRGGWSDRNGVYYSENPNDNNLSSINITFSGISKK